MDVFDLKFISFTDMLLFYRISVILVTATWTHIDRYRGELNTPATGKCIVILFCVLFGKQSFRKFMLVSVWSFFGLENRGIQCRPRDEDQLQWFLNIAISIKNFLLTLSFYFVKFSLLSGSGRVRSFRFLNRRWIYVFPNRKTKSSINDFKLYSFNSRFFWF